MASASIARSPEPLELSEHDVRDNTQAVTLEVQMLTGKPILSSASFLAASPILSVKEAVKAVAGIPTRNQGIIWQSSVLANDCALRDLSLPSEGAVLQLVVSLPPEDRVAEAMRSVTEAEASLDVLDAKALAEVKSLSRPPAAVMLVLSSVMELRAGLDPALEVDSRGRLKDRSWKAARSMIKDPNKFLRDLQAFKTLVDNGQVPARNVQAAYAVRDSFANPHQMAATSTAMASLCAWVLNIIRYHEMVSQFRTEFGDYDIMAEIKERLGQ